MILTAVYDRATEAYGAIMTNHNRGQAIRAFRDECNSKESMLNKHPSDYELYQLAHYDQNLGEITPDHDLLARAEDMKEN